MLLFFFTPGRKLNSVLIYTIQEEQLYVLSNKYKKYDRYECRSEECRAAINVFKDVKRIVKRANQINHQHLKQCNNYLVFKFMDEVKRKVMEDEGLNVFPSNIYDEVALR